jgi:hypothetical protein
MLLALLLAAGPSDSSPHLALGAGAGLAYAYLGVHAEIRWKKVAVFAATTPFLSLATNNPDTQNGFVFATGARFLSNGDSGLLISVQGTWARYEYPIDRSAPGSATDQARHDTYTATIGGRLRFARFYFVEFGVGGGVAHDVDHHGDPSSGRLGPLYRATSAYPDGVLALGFEI